MVARKLERPTILGAGLMGHALAADLASHGFQVTLHSRSTESLEKGMNGVNNTLGRLQALGMLNSAEAEAATVLVQAEPNFRKAVESADIVIEAVYEDPEVKRDVFFKLAEACHPTTILASTTSSLNVGLFAKGLPNPERAILTHYFFPPGIVQAVEVALTEYTSPESLAVVRDFLERSGKRPVVMSREMPGMIANRLYGALLREAGSLVDQGVTTPEDIDFLLKSVVGVRYGLAGIFELGDVPGWELIVDNLPSLLNSLESSTAIPNVYLEKRRSGEFGIKSGRGFYDWPIEKVEAFQRRMAMGLIQNRKLHES